ncbi:MAG: diguanylate cyclase [Spirochaetia bacterium]|nr:diguanylate cyclase [Spirochaetia bacterium]
METNQIYLEILKQVKEGVYFVDTNRKITFWNDHAEQITGFNASEVLNKHCFDNILNHVDDEGNHLCKEGCPLHLTVVDGIKREASVYLHHKNGYRVPVKIRIYPLYDNGLLIGAIELFTDEKLPKELLKDIENLKVLAMTDQLTGMANRRYLESFLSNKIKELEEFNTPFGIAMIDIDYFKVVNDTYGHDTGDLTLQMASKSLVNAIRSTDIVGRWGGDEFLVIFSAQNIEQLEQISERMRMLVETSSVQRKETNIHITISIGAVFVQSATTKDEIINIADKLMYQSKQKGRNCFSDRIL